MQIQLDLARGNLTLSEGIAFAVIAPGPMAHVLATFFHRSDADLFCRRHPDGAELDIVTCYQRVAVWCSDLPVDRERLRTALSK